MSDKSFNLTLKNLLLTGIVGWITALYTLWHRAKVQAGLDIGESFCNINSSINCDTVAISKYSAIGPVSVPTLGLIYFTIAILLAMRALKQSRASGVGLLTQKLLLVVGAVGVLSSIAFAAISLSQIGAFCLVCAIVYLLCISFAYLSWKVHRHARAGASAAVNDRLPALTLVLFAAAVATQFVFEPMANFAARADQAATEEKVPPEIAEQILSQYRNESSYEIPDQKSPAVGAADAKVTLVEFSDFECPHCAAHHKNLPKSLRLFGDKVRVIYKNYPLDPACNQGGSHKHACYAAWAARCVFKSKGIVAYQEMADHLFANRESLSRDFIRSKAEDLGLGAAALNSCVESAETQAEIRDEISLANSLGVSSTPSLFINGRLFNAATNPGLLQVVIKDLLK